MTKTIPKNTSTSSVHGWQIKKLEEVCDIFNGLWKGKKPPYIEVGVIRNTNFTKEGYLDDSKIAYLPVEEKQYTKRKLEYGDIILEKSGGGPKQPVGRVILFDKKNGEFSFSNFTSAVRVLNKEILNFNFLHRFLYFQYISGATEKMQRRSTGIRNLQLKEYKQIQIPLPPLPEQIRITKILDKAFEKLEIAKKNAEKNLVNAKELFESYLQGVFENDKYKYVELGSLLELLTDYHANGSYKILKKNVELLEEKDYAWMVRSTDFENNFQNKLKYISKSSYEFLKKSKIFGGEIIMSKIGNAGKVYLMPKINEYCSLAMNLFLLRFKKDKINNEFLYYFLLSNKGEFQIQSRIKGAATKTITKDNVRSIKIPLTSLDEQQKIVKKLDHLSTQTKKLEKIYQQKMDNLDELKKSLLQQAFEGKW